jgi:hypothetical protein
MSDPIPSNPEKDKDAEKERRDSLPDDLIRAEFADLSRACGRPRNDASDRSEKDALGAGDQDKAL